MASVTGRSPCHNKAVILYFLIAKDNLNAIQDFMGPLPYLERKRIVNALTKYRTTIFHFACYRGYLKIVEYLAVECGADVNVVYKDPKVTLTPLFVAISTYNYRMVKLLVKLGADLEWKNLYGENIIMYACKYTQFYHATYLQKSGAQIKGDRNIRLCAQSLNYCLVSFMVGTHANDVDSKHDSIFILAAELGNVAVLNILRQFNVDIYHRNKFGNNALCAAIWRKQNISYKYFVESVIYSKIDYALAYELCGARLILFRSDYDEALKMWIKSIKIRLSVSNGIRKKLEYYFENNIKPIKEFVSVNDIVRLRGNPRACYEQAQLVYARIFECRN